MILTHNAAVDLQATHFNFPISTGNGPLEKKMAVTGGAIENSTLSLQKNP